MFRMHSIVSYAMIVIFAQGIAIVIHSFIYLSDLWLVYLTI